MSGKSSFLLLLFVFSFSLFSCENDIATVRKVTLQEEVSVETGQNVEMLYSADAKVRAKLNAPLLERHNDKNPFVEMPKGLKLVFYNDSLVVNSTLTAKYGITYENSHEMIVRDNVKVVNVNGDILNTEELVWNEQTEKITSDKFVKIQTQDEIIYGDGLEANQDLTNYKIKKIRGTIRLKNNPVTEE